MHKKNMLPALIRKLDHRLIFVFLSLATTTIGAGLLNFVYQILVASALTQQQFVYFASVLSSSVLFGVLANTLQYFILQKVQGGLGCGNLSAQHRRSLLYLASVNGTILFLVFLVAVLMNGQLFEGENQVYRIALPSVLILWSALLLKSNLGVAQALGDFKHVNAINIAGPLIKMALLMIAMWFHLVTAVAAISFLFVSNFLTFFGGIFWFLRKRFLDDSKKMTSTHKAAPTNTPIKLIFLHHLGFAYFSQTDILFINATYSTSVSSSLILAATVAKCVLYIANGFVLALYPYLLDRKSNNQGSSAVFLNCVIIFSLLSLGMVCFFHLFGEQLIQHLFAGKYTMAATFLASYCLILIPLAAAFLFDTLFLASKSGVLGWFSIIAAPVQFLAFKYIAVDSKDGLTILGITNCLLLFWMMFCLKKSNQTPHDT